MNKVITIKVKESTDTLKPKLRKAAKRLKYKSVNAMLNESINQLISKK